jgi:MFS family permease
MNARHRAALGGFLVDKVSWRWIFYLNVPIGVAPLFFGALALREHREPSRTCASSPRRWSRWLGRPWRC